MNFTLLFFDFFDLFLIIYLENSLKCDKFVNELFIGFFSKVTIIVHYYLRCMFVP